MYLRRVIREVNGIREKEERDEETAKRKKVWEAV
jgi:hypothetical protein